MNIGSVNSLKASNAKLKQANNQKQISFKSQNNFLLSLDKAVNALQDKFHRINDQKPVIQPSTPEEEFLRDPERALKIMQIVRNQVHNQISREISAIEKDVTNTAQAKYQATPEERKEYREQRFPELLPLAYRQHGIKANIDSINAFEEVTLLSLDAQIATANQIKEKFSRDSKISDIPVDLREVQKQVNAESNFRPKFDSILFAPSLQENLTPQIIKLYEID